MKTFDQCVVIEALAGAGKTYKLSHRFLQLIEMGADPSSILATTFSRKAAGEIRDRIIETAASAVLHEDSRNELFESIPDMEQSRKACVKLLRTIVSNLHRLEIGTIDSFFVRTAKAFGDEMGFSPQWSILDELQEKAVLCEAVMDMLHSNDLDLIAKTIQSAEASTTVPVVDTIDKIGRYAYDVLRQTGIEPWQWGEKATTLSEKSLNAAIKNLEEQESEEEGQLKTLQNDIGRAKSGEWRNFLTTGLPKGIVNGTMKFSSRPIDPAIVESLQPVIEHAGAILLNQLRSKNAGIVSLMSALNESWSGVKHELGLYRFDDVTYYLGECSVLEDLQELAFRLDSRVDHLLIDEFQDTSIPQWKILKLLVDEIHQSSSDRSLFFVGDPKQSLYGFRGGDPQLLWNLPTYLGIGEPDRLPTSWRCSKPVLDLVNTVFEGAKESKLLLQNSTEGVSEWMQSYKQHIAARPERLGYAEVHTTKVDENGKTNLENTIEKVTEVVRKIHGDCPDATIGILVRKRTNQRIQRIVHALRSHQTHPIMACEHGGNPLTDSPQVTIVLSALLIADHPGDTASLFHVSTSELGESLHLEPTANRQDANKISEKLRFRLSKDGYANVVQELAEPLFKSASKRDQLRLWQLIELAESYSEEETLRPSVFVEFVKNKSVTDPATSNVQVMTVHASKGLGFDAVVVCDLDEPLWKPPKLLMLHEDQCEPPARVSVRENENLNSLIPDQQEMWEECKSKQVQESLSLLYVAMTRAKHALHLVIPPRPLSKTSKNPKPSVAKTFDRLLRQSIGLDECLPADEVVWSSKLNNKNWSSEIKSEDRDSSDNLIGAIKFASSDQHSRAIATASPSSLEGGGKTKVTSRFSGDIHGAFDRGTVVHGWFEDILWLEDDLPTVEYLVASASSEAVRRLTLERVADVAQLFIEAIQCETVNHLLQKPKEPVSVFREHEFLLRVNKGTSFAGVTMQECTDIQGTIDRLVVYYKNDSSVPIQAEIIDWKTDTFESEELEEKLANYAPQLASYRLAVAKLLDIDIEKVSACLAFAMEGRVEDVTTLASVDIP